MKVVAKATFLNTKTKNYINIEKMYVCVCKMYIKAHKIAKSEKEKKRIKNIDNY